MSHSSAIDLLRQQRLLLQMEYYCEKEAFRKLTELTGLLRKVKRVNDYQAMLQKYDEAFESEIKNFNELTFVGRCVRLEAELT